MLLREDIDRDRGGRVDALVALVELGLLDEVLVALQLRGRHEVVHGRRVDVAAEDELFGGDHPALQHVILLGQRSVEVGLGHIVLT